MRNLRISAGVAVLGLVASASPAIAGFTDTAVCGANDGFGDMHSVLNGGSGDKTDLRLGAINSTLDGGMASISGGGLSGGSGGHLGDTLESSTEPMSITGPTGTVNEPSITPDAGASLYG